MAQEYDDSAFNYDQEIDAPVDLGDINRWLLEVDEEKERLIHKLKGEIWDKTDQKWIIKNKAWVNNEGINVIEGHIDSVINKVNLLSNFDDETISEIAISNMLALDSDLSENAEEYKIETTKLELIITLIDNFEWAVLLRAKNAGERGLFRKIQYSVQRLYKQPEKEGASSLAPFGK